MVKERGSRCPRSVSEEEREVILDLFILPSLAMSSTINRVNEKSRTGSEEGRESKDCPAITNPALALPRLILRRCAGGEEG